MKTVLHSTARNEANILELTQLVTEVCHRMRDLAVQVQQLTQTTNEVDFSPVKEGLPLSSIEDFKDFDNKINDAEFCDLLVSI